MRCDKHCLQGKRERGENADERDDTFPLLNLDFCIFNRSYLLIEKLREEADESSMEFLQSACEILLARFFQF